MKKNFTMRTAAIVLALILATACLVSGTFAKYVTVVTGTDTARVAFFKFGADNLGEDATANFNLWNTVNDDDVLGEDGNIGVDDAKIIAPGTSGSMDLGLWGMAEVDTWVDYELALADGSKDIPLVFAYTAEDDTVTYYSEYFTVGDQVWLNIGESADDDVNADDANIAANAAPITIAGKLDALAVLMDRELIAGTKLEASDAEFDTITWFWAYENWGVNAPNTDALDVTVGDEYDTDLGNAAVDVTTETNAEGATVNNYAPVANEAILNVTVTFTQID